MRTLSSDTSAEAEAVLIDLVRGAPVWKRLQMIDEMHETLRLLAIADLKRSYPNADESGIRRHLIRRLFSRSEIIAAYGWDPDTDKD